MVSAQQSGEQMASYYYQKGEFDKAAELYESLYANTRNIYYYRTLLECYINLQRFKEAERLVDQRIKQTSNDLTLYVDLGRLQQMRGDNKKSAKTFDEAIRRIGTNTKQTNDLAIAFDNYQRPDLALQVYLTARTKTRNPFQYIPEVASLYQRMGRYDDIAAEYFSLLDKSPGSLGSIQISLQGMMRDDPSPQLTQAIRSALAAKIQEQPDAKHYLEMMIWFALQQKDFEFALMQAQAVDARFPDKGAEQVMRVAAISEGGDALQVAADAYNYVVAKGKDNPNYIKARIGSLNVAFKQLNINYPLPVDRYKKLKQMYSDAFEELGRSASTVQLMRNYANLLAYYGGEVEDAADVLYDVLEMPRLNAQVVNATKLELGDLLLFAGSVWDASLLYMQVEKANKNDVIGYNAKFKNAMLSYYNHDFPWAKSQLDVLRASTSKLIANDAMQLSLLISDNMEDDSTYTMLEYFASAQLMLYRNQLDSAWRLLDEISTQTLAHPLLDDVMLEKARIQMKRGEYIQADTLLARLVQFYPSSIIADDALFLRAELNTDKLNNPLVARECYEQILLDYPASLYVDTARKRYKTLPAPENN
ncbi:MAG: tetratricopeptide repeat protein [Bacteroidales bacterium]|nr:tetratricopeptide repeat protein [Bacteroidales bacterium]